MIGATHNPCSTCGKCCSAYIVNVCGYDVWHIRRRQGLSPEQFIVTIPQNELQADGFLLDNRRPGFGMALDKVGKYHPDKPCIFLVRLPGSHDRCGIYDHRPVVCQAYPMAYVHNVVVQTEKALCPLGSWSDAARLRPSWRAALQRLRMRFDVYHEIVARWNAHVAAAGPDVSFSFVQFSAYLMQVYDRLDAFDDVVGPTLLAEVEATWPKPPGQADPAVIPDNEEAPPWLGYIFQAQKIMDEFFPELGPTRELGPLPMLATPTVSGV